MLCPLNMRTFYKGCSKGAIIISAKLITIDGSTQKTAVAYFYNGKYREHNLLDFSKDKDAFSRFESMAKNLWKLLDFYNPNIIYIEETYSAVNPQTTKILTRLQGVVYAWCINNQCDFNTITPSQWRKQLKFIQGKGIKREQLKEQSIKYILYKYSLLVTDDEADAICIGDAVLKMFGDDR